MIPEILFKRALAIIDLVATGALTSGVLGELLGGSAGLWVRLATIILAIFGAITSTISGLIGRLLKR